MKLAVRKDEGSIPGAGFHYMLMPLRLEGPNKVADADILALTGHVIIEVSDEVGERLLKEAVAALNHQVEVATLAEKALHDHR